MPIWGTWALELRTPWFAKSVLKIMFICLYLSEEVEIKFSDDKAWLVNKEYGTEPLVAHGNGPSKVLAKLLSDQQLRIKYSFLFCQ